MERIEMAAEICGVDLERGSLALDIPGSLLAGVHVGDPAKVVYYRETAQAQATGHQHTQAAMPASCPQCPLDHLCHFSFRECPDCVAAWSALRRHFGCA